MTTTERPITIWRLAAQVREAGKDTRDVDKVLGKLQKLKRPGRADEDGEEGHHGVPAGPQATGAAMSEDVPQAGRRIVRITVLVSSHSRPCETDCRAPDLTPTERV
jgi:hypothetical protein